MPIPIPDAVYPFADPVLLSVIGVLATGMALLGVIFLYMGVGPWKLPRIIATVPELAQFDVDPKKLLDKWYGVKHGVTKGIIKLGIIFGSLFFITVFFNKVLTPNVDYRDFPVLGPRIAIWLAAELHLLFSAFVLGVPVFAVILEYVAHVTKSERYDKLS